MRILNKFFKIFQKFLLSKILLKVPLNLPTEILATPLVYIVWLYSTGIELNSYMKFCPMLPRGPKSWRRPCDVVLIVQTH